MNINRTRQLWHVVFAQLVYNNPMYKISRNEVLLVLALSQVNSVCFGLWLFYIWILWLLIAFSISVGFLQTYHHHHHHQQQPQQQQLRRVQTTTTPGFCSHSLERSHARHDCSRGSEPVTWIGFNFHTHSLLLYDAWILPELWKRYSLWAIVGCKLYKVCFCSPVFCQKLELVISMLYFCFKFQRSHQHSRTYNVGSLQWDWNTARSVVVQKRLRWCRHNSKVATATVINWPLITTLEW